MTDHTSTERHYPHGVPSWVDTEQPDPDAAARFYGDLFGWEIHDAVPPDVPDTYLIATLDGHDVAAIAPGSDDPAWNTYIACDDADRAAAAIVEAGGTVVTAPEDVGPAGRLARCADPQGAAFRLWQARRRLGAQLVNSPGTWNFSDLHTPDPAVLGFYTTVFGWVHDDAAAGMIRVPGYGEHLAATIDPDIHERQAFAPKGFADVVAGLTVTGERPGWQVRFTVSDRDDSVSTAERLGAVTVSSADTEWTREAVIRDPQGATLTLSQFTPPS